MFGLFKKKPVEANPMSEIKFTYLLGAFATEFRSVMRQVDPEAEEEIVSRAYNNYLNRGAAEANFQPWDFFMDAYTGAIFDLLIRNIIPPHHAHAVFSLTEKWLQERPQYLTETIDSLMNTWEGLLKERGVDTRYALY